ncbi:MAG: thiamine pyrophosphate-dependent dehydrogenase E1 component subunit alpha [Candidatus Omnitrophica bacterium]|nr:thiamine pyrophosphate-dependent dehydrogenase E1 component subunit alpha [Candidatus Omnitrophota bacterium]
MKNPLVGPAVLKNLYYYLVKIRRFEEKVIELYPGQEIRCPVHLCIGQEAIAVGFCANLRKDDYIFSNHRNHGHLIAKGMQLDSMFAELYGRSAGCSEGKGGSMHMVSTEHGIMGTSAIVAGGIPIAAGAALSSKMKKDKRVTTVFFGDGAVDEGVFYETLNFSALKKLPVVFVCENNSYATNSPQRDRQANIDIYKIADFFHVPGKCIDGNDVLEVYKTAKECIGRARDGRGPSLIEARTYRWKTHVGPETDIEKGLRDAEEVEEWFKKCPLKKFRQHVLKNGLVKEKELAGLEKKADKEISEALDFALGSPYPEEKELYKGVY